MVAAAVARSPASPVERQRCGGAGVVVGSLVWPDLVQRPPPPPSLLPPQPSLLPKPLPLPPALPPGSPTRNGGPPRPGPCVVVAALRVLAERLLPLLGGQPRRDQPLVVALAVPAAGVVGVVEIPPLLPLARRRASSLRRRPREERCDRIVRLRGHRRRVVATMAGGARRATTAEASAQVARTAPTAATRCGLIRPSPPAPLHTRDGAAPRAPAAVPSGGTSAPVPNVHAAADPHPHRVRTAANTKGSTDPVRRRSRRRAHARGRPRPAPATRVTGGGAQPRHARAAGSPAAPAAARSGR